MDYIRYHRYSVVDIPPIILRSGRYQAWYLPVSLYPLLSMFMRLLPIFFVLLLLLTGTSLYIHYQPLPKRQTFSHAIPSVQTRTSHRAYTDLTPDSYYQIIIDANIFRLIGWRPPVKKTRYELIGTTRSDKPTAILLDKQSNQQFTLQIGEKIGEARLEKIEPKRVILT